MQAFWKSAIDQLGDNTRHQPEETAVLCGKT
jgi:hypothetical protein